MSCAQQPRYNSQNRRGRQGGQGKKGEKQRGETSRGSRLCCAMHRRHQPVGANHRDRKKDIKKATQRGRVMDCVFRGKRGPNVNQRANTSNNSSQGDTKPTKLGETRHGYAYINVCANNHPTQNARKPPLSRVRQENTEDLPNHPVFFDGKRIKPRPQEESVVRVGTTRGVFEPVESVQSRTNSR